MLTTLQTAFKFAGRELRSGLSGFRLFLICLMLGVAVIAGVGSVSANIQDSINSEARSILGGDVSLRLTSQKITTEQRRFLESRGTLSEVIELRAMAHNTANESRTLVELKAVDQSYPLFGSITLSTNDSLDTAFRPDNRRQLPGAAVEETLLTKLNLTVGEQITVGEQTFQITGIIDKEPDKAVSAFSFGPRVMIALKDLDATQLLQPGSLSRARYRLAFTEGVALEPFLDELSNRFPDANWRVRTYEDPAPGLERFVDRISKFLVMVGLATLLIGGVGISNAVRHFLSQKLESIATLKCIGAQQKLVQQIYFLQILIMAAAGILTGLVAGAVAPLLIKGAFGNLFPFTLRNQIYPEPLVSAAVFGFLIAVLFSYLPLVQASKVKPAALFRAVVNFPKTAFTRINKLVITILSLAVGVLVFYVAPTEELAAGFIASVVGSFIIFHFMAKGIFYLCRQLQMNGHHRWRMAVNNLIRPGNQTRNLLLSLGLGLSVLATIQLIDGNLRHALVQELPEKAPAFFFIDIQPDQVEQFDKLVGSIAGVNEINRVPSLRGRIDQVNGIPVEEVNVKEGARWAVESDRGVTYAGQKPENANIIRGSWWPESYDGPPLVSIDDGIAKGLGVDVGDTITMNIFGRNIHAEIANLREINWRSLGINFTFMFSPGLLEQAPHTHIATVYADLRAEDALQSKVNEALPNVSAIRVKEALEDANKILRSITAASRVIGILSLIAGIFVLVGAMLATHQRRKQESVTLKVLGATRFEIIKTQLLEYTLVAVFACAVSLVISLVLSAVFSIGVLELEWVVIASSLVTPFALAVFIVLAFASIASWQILSEKPATYLRNE